MGNYVDICIKPTWRQTRLACPIKMQINLGSLVYCTFNQMENSVYVKVEYVHTPHYWGSLVYCTFNQMENSVYVKVEYVHTPHY